MTEREHTEPTPTLAALERSEQDELHPVAGTESSEAPPPTAATRPSFLPSERPEPRDLLSRLLPSLTPASAVHTRPPSRPPEPRGDAAAVHVATLPPQALPSDPEAAPAEVRSPSGGLISTILGQTAASTPGDQGALAALRTLPRRAAPDLDYADPVGHAERASARVELLCQLAERCQGSRKARLLTQAAELLTRGGERERALQLYANAVAVDPSQRVAAIQLRRERQRRGEHAAARELLRAEAENAGDPRERSLALCALAELDASLGAPAAQRIETLREAARMGRGSLLAPLLLAREQLAQAELAELAAALKDCADEIVDPSARALCLLEAARALERAGLDEQALASHEAASGTDRAVIARVRP